MAFDPGRFWAAFQAAGMLVEATYQPAAGPAVAGIQINLLQPDVALLGELVQSTEYEAEFQTADMPNLVVDETLTIGAEVYKVRRPPMKTGDGFFSKVVLSKS